MLALDLGVFHRRAHAVSMKEALFWSVVWTIVGLLFAIFVYYGYDSHWEGLGIRPDPVDHVVNSGFTATMKYLTGFVVERALSADNIFVIAMSSADPRQICTRSFQSRRRAHAPGG
jgi:tellurite resistance protein TerC